MPRQVDPDTPRSSRRVASRLEIDTASLLGANAVNLVLGLGFWAIAARLYPTGVVGQATTIVASAISLASFANIGLGPVIERFLPLSGRLAGAYVQRAHLVSAICSGAVAAGVVLVDPVEGLLDGPAQRVAYVVLVVVLAAYALQDSELIALGSSRLAAAKNVVLSVVKLAGVAVGAAVGTTLMLVGAWLVPAAAIAVAVAVLVARGKAKMQPRMMSEHPTLPARREIAGFWGVTVAWLVAGSVPGFVVPLQVAHRLGLTNAAYFNAAWMIVAASTVFMSLATSPFVAAASRPDVDIRARTIEFVRFMAIVGVLRSVGLAVAGSAALYVYGSDYAEAGGPLVVVMALVHGLSIPAYIFGGLARVYRRIWYPMAVNALGSLVVVLLVGRWVDQFGLIGVGYAYLVQEILTLGLAAVPLARVLRTALSGERPPLQVRPDSAPDGDQPT